METLAILGIALIIVLITLGVMAFAYKASPTQPAKVTAHISQVKVGKKEATPLTPFPGRLALVVDMTLLNGDIRPIAINETEEAHEASRRN